MKIVKGLLLASCFLFFSAVSSFALQVGDPAPDFQALSTAGAITLAQSLQQGPVVLAFYYADFTPV